MSFNVTIKGIPALKARLSPDTVGKRIRPALLQSGLIVQEAAQKTVHSPDNPYVGKAGHSVATGRLQASIGTSDVRGSGINQSVAVGTPYGKGGAARGTFARSAALTPTGRPGSSRTRTGGRKNKGDVRVYGPIEEKRHPFLVPSLERNVNRIRDIISRAISGEP